jgi:hypothetical protein
MKKTVIITILSGLLLAGLAFGPCVEKRELENAGSLAGFTVDITGVSGAGGGEGKSDNPYDYPLDEISISFSAQAYDRLGNPLPDFNGTVGVKVTPGELVYPETKVVFADGQAQGSIQVRKVFGRVAMWLEDVHRDLGEVARRRADSPATCASTMECPQGAVCTDGSCWYEIQLETKTGTWATGVSPLVHFDVPTLRQIQWDPWITSNDVSSLDRHFVEIDCRAGDPLGPWEDGHGQLVVTGVFNEGFFVTDLADAGQGYNHLYVYTYSYPEDTEVGDRLDRLGGTTQDFSGCTQISFPNWLRSLDENLDPQPFRVTDLDGVMPPTTVTTAMCADGGGANQHLCGHSKQNWQLEALESSRARIENLRAPDVFVNCDLDGNLEVVPDWEDAGHPEAMCSVACLKHDGTEEFVVKEFAASQSAYADVVVQENVVCPWEVDIVGIQPNCTRVRIPPGHICSELSVMHQYGQWVVALDDGEGPLVNIMTRETLVEYDPTTETNLGAHIDYLQGNLRQVRAARPRWMILVGNQPGDVPDNMKP